MKRYTEYHNGVAVIKDKALLKDAMRKLAHYEDLEEQGLLLRLPCKVGDYVYSVEWNGIARYIVSDFDVCMKSIYAYQGDYFIGEMGYKVFATKAEAEKALEEMEK